MKDFINILYKNHYLLYKVILFVFTTALIVYLFPKSGKFKYSFQNGKPWQSENLYAPFDFAIKKSQDEINAEIEKIENEAVQYFDVDSSIIVTSISNFKSEFKKIFPDSIQQGEYNKIYSKSDEILQKVYKYGVLKESYNYNPNAEVVLLSNQKEINRITFSNLINITEIRNLLDSTLR